ncbi:MAG: hypothetical protein U0325_25710 [Polyangiales bacterium]
MAHPRYDALLTLLDAERDEERARLDELLRTLSPEERAARGITLLDLACVDERYGLGGRIVLDLARDDRSPSPPASTRVTSSTSRPDAPYRA